MTNIGITIGKLAARTGVAVSAVRFYADENLISCTRNPSGQRLFPRSAIRRVSFILVSQKFGYTLKQIKDQLDALPNNRTPSKSDWEKMSHGFAMDIDRKIEELTKLRDTLSGCIGCGCLSLENCHLYNPDDKAASLGSGPRYLLGDSSQDLVQQGKKS